MNRREFLKVSGALLLMSEFVTKDLLAGETPIVAVAEGQDYGAITKGAINALGGMGRFVNAGIPSLSSRTWAGIEGRSRLPRPIPSW